MGFERTAAPQRLAADEDDTKRMGRGIGEF